MAMIMDKAEMELVAKAVIRFNRYARPNAWEWTVEGVTMSMRSMAYNELYAPTLVRDGGVIRNGKREPANFCGTSGWYLSAFDAHNGDRVIRVTVSASILSDMLFDSD